MDFYCQSVQLLLPVSDDDDDDDNNNNNRKKGSIWECAVKVHDT